MSVAGVKALILLPICSGGAKPGVLPSRVEVFSPFTSSYCLETPKSMRVTLPLLPSIMFPGFMSRWRRFVECTWARASAAARMIRVASASVNTPSFIMTSLNELPSMYSIT